MGKTARPSAMPQNRAGLSGPAAGLPIAARHPRPSARCRVAPGLLPRLRTRLCLSDRGAGPSGLQGGSAPHGPTRLSCAQETQGQSRRVSAGASSPGFTRTRAHALTRTRAHCRVARPVRGRLLERPANPAPVPGALHPRGLCLSGCVLAFTVLKMKMSSLKNISLFVEKK